VGNGLKLVEAAPAPCAIIGQPSDIAGVARARTLRPELERKIALTMSFFCAGSPPTAATKSLLQAHGVDADAVADLRYRGLGWPGHFAANLDGQSNPSVKLTYRESWAFLQAFRPWSVQMWPDSSGELADISCGDPWYFEPDGVNPGSSIVLVRTERGREILRGAISAGFLHLQCAEPWKVEKSQQGLWRKKGSVWGRQLAHRMLGLPTTEISGGHLWDCWKELTLGEKLRSVFGTGRRILQRKLYIPGKLRTEEGAPVRPAVLAEGLRK
jgi:coenzyme F420 hydrogenase subunit beta